MDETSRGDELRALGWVEEDVRRYQQLWKYRHRWGASHLDRDERRFLRNAEAVLSAPQSNNSMLVRTVPNHSQQRSEVTATQPALHQSLAPSKGSSLGSFQHDCFVALDFETADQGKDSACSIALVRVERRTIVHREYRLIRPPRRTFVFTSIHGISWSQVADAPTFGELWPELAPLLEGARFIAAHNASFDANVMRACCDHAAMPPPTQPYLCTVKLARQAWNLRPTTLPDVCRHLGLSLQHHDALSDAEACANIVLAANQDKPSGSVGGR